MKKITTQFRNNLNETWEIFYLTPNKDSLPKKTLDKINPDIIGNFTDHHEHSIIVFQLSNNGIQFIYHSNYR